MSESVLVRLIGVGCVILALQEQTSTPAPEGTGLILAVGAGALVAICGVLLAWLKWSKPKD